LIWCSRWQLYPCHSLHGSTLSAKALENLGRPFIGITNERAHDFAQVCWMSHDAVVVVVWDGHKLAVVITVQYQMDQGSPIFSVLTINMVKYLNEQLLRIY
jgi:hypothetical protein